MLQRIQTVYYALAIICLLIVTLGLDVFSLHLSEDESFNIHAHYNSYGIQAKGTASDNLAELKSKSLKSYLSLEEDSKVSKFNTPVSKMPLYIVSIVLLLGVLGAMLSFKNYKRQIKLGRFSFFFTFLCLIAVTILFYIAGDELNNLSDVELTKSLGAGFYGLVLSVAFIFLGNIGVRRDKNLVSSLDRLR